MSRTIDKNTGGRHEIMTKKFNERKVGDGLICNKCKKVQAMEEYDRNKSYCRACRRKAEKAKYKRSKYKLW